MSAFGLTVLIFNETKQLANVQQCFQVSVRAIEAVVLWSSAFTDSQLPHVVSLSVCIQHLVLNLFSL